MVAAGGGVPLSLLFLLSPLSLSLPGAFGMWEALRERERGESIESTSKEEEEEGLAGILCYV